MTLRERAFGSTGTSFPEIGLKAGAVGGDQDGSSAGPADDAPLRTAIGTALELGVEVFATTDVDGHGHGQEVLGEALGDQDQIFIEVGFDRDESGQARWDPGDLRKALETSLGRLDRDRVALFQLHDPPRETMIDPDTYAFLEELKDEGLTRWTGFSVRHLEEALAIKDHGEADAVQLPVSILQQDTLDAIPELAEAGIAVIAREPLANGSLTGKPGSEAMRPEGDIWHRRPKDRPRVTADRAKQAIGVLAEHGIEDPVAGALGFVLAHEVSVVLLGTSTPDRVRQSILAAQELGGLPEACLQELYGLWDEA